MSLKSDIFKLIDSAPWNMCARCGENERRSPSQRWCKSCHNEYMRENRPKHRELSGEARRKANCRSYANVYKNRGLLVPEPCEVCGSVEVEMHHDDYSKPVDIRWLCPTHHQNVTNNNLAKPI